MWRALLIGCLFVSHIIFSKPMTRQQQLKKIDTSIHHLSHRLTQTTQKRQALQSIIDHNEHEIASLSAEKNMIGESLANKQTSIEQLKQEIIDVENQLRNQEVQVDELTRAIYMLGNTPTFRALFNPEDKQQHNRQLSYYRYIVRHYLLAVEALNTTRRVLANKQQTLQNQFNQLLTIKRSLIAKNTQLKKAYQQHQAELTKLDKYKQTQQQKLQSLIYSRDKLNQQVKTSTTAKQNTQLSKRPFGNRKHHLRWPVHGRLIQHFGSVIAHSKLHTDAIVIKATTGSLVHAIAPGKVLYSGWMPHYGQLLIITHGDDYLSLYGYNESLSVVAGDIVTTGQIIATVGQSGGHHHPALYFGIRHHSQALNPIMWLA